MKKRKYTKRTKTEIPSQTAQPTRSPMKAPVNGNVCPRPKYQSYNDIPEPIRGDIEGTNKWMISCGVKDDLETRKKRALEWWRKCG